MKHLQHTFKTPETLETYACNIMLCNIQKYFHNMQIKHLKHTSETPKTYAWNILLQHTYIAIVIYVKSRWNTWNISPKHLKYGIAGNHGLPGGSYSRQQAVLGYSPFRWEREEIVSHSCEFHSGTARNGRNVSYRSLNRYRKATIPYRVKYRSIPVNAGQYRSNTGQYRLIPANIGQYRAWLYVLYFSMYELWSLKFEIRSYKLVEWHLSLVKMLITP
jgi:hypothetical protein